MHWRQKGLLPPLTHEGLGRGKGLIYYWKESDILSQAIAAHFLLGKKARIKPALLNLWLAGYNVNEGLARTEWLQQLENEQSRISQKAQAAGGLENLLSNWVVRIANRENSVRSDRLNSFKDLASIFLSTAYDPKFEFDQSDQAAILIEFANQDSFDDDQKYSENLVSVFRPILFKLTSIEEMRKAIHSTSELELQNAHSDLKEIRISVQRLHSILFPQSTYMESIYVSLLIMGLIGKPIALSHIYLQISPRQFPTNKILNSIHMFIDSLTAEDIKHNKSGIPILTKRAQKRFNKTRKTIKMYLELK